MDDSRGSLGDNPALNWEPGGGADGQTVGAQPWIAPGDEGFSVDVPPAINPREAETRAMSGPSTGAVAFPEPGAELCGFRLLSELGRGAFGRVYLASQRSLGGRPVALKVARALGEEPENLARLQHANIVPIHSVHDDPATGLRLLCMPYVGGANLAQVLEGGTTRAASLATGRSLIEALDRVAFRSMTAEGAVESTTPYAPYGRAVTRGLGSPSAVRSRWARRWASVPWLRSLVGEPPAEPPTALAVSLGAPAPARRYLGDHTYVQATVWIVARLAEGLAHAHERGLLHRDIKPSNILIAADGTPMLLDFNLAATIGGEAAGEQARLGGTLPYMAPEHLDGFNPRSDIPPSAVDERSDLYALGLILFEMLAGRHPFDDPPQGMALLDVLTAMAAQRRGPIPRARALNPQVTPGLESILARCLDPEPDRRYQGAAEMAEDLRRYLDDLPLRHARDRSPRERANKWLRRHPGARSAGFVATVAAGALVALGMMAYKVADGLEVASAQVARADARRDFDRSTLLLNTQSSEPKHRAMGVKLAEAALARYDVGGHRELRAARRLPAAERRSLREELAEIALLRARAAAQGARASSPEGRRSLAAAVAWLGHAERLDPAPPRTLYLERARLRQALGDADGAAVDRARAGALAPKSARDFYLLGTATLAEGRPDAAEPLLGRAVGLEPRRFWAWFALGLCHHDQRRFDVAAADFAVCSAIEPEFAWPAHNRGLSLAAAGRLAEADAAYDRAIDLAPDFVEAHVNRALVSLELDRPRAALADLDRAQTLGRRDASVLAARAEALARLGRRDEAAAAFDKAIALRPDDPAIRVARGFSRLGVDARAAEADFREALEAHPDDPRALLGLARSLRRDDPRAALGALDRALAVDPRSADALQLRALLRARANDRAALADVDRLAASPTPLNLYNGACALSILAADDASLADRALALLARAVEAGHPAADLAADVDLKPLRGLPGFESLARRP